MNDDLKELYQEILLELAKSSTRRGRASGSAAVFAVNPLCGDEIEFSTLKVAGLVDQARYQCRGCAISQAAAALVAQSMEGKEVLAAKVLIGDALSFISTGFPDLIDGDWAALGGVKRFPLRVKCATMPLRAALASLDHEGKQDLDVDAEVAP